MIARSGQNTLSEKQNGQSTVGILFDAAGTGKANKPRSMDSPSVKAHTGQLKGYSDMLTATLKRDLEIAIETALLLGSETSVPELAKQVYRSEPVLMQQVQEAWALERLTWMMYRKRQLVANQQQYILPGFEKLPRRLAFNGRYARLHVATLAQLQEFRAVLADKKDRRLAILDDLIALVKKHASHRKPGITVGEVFALEAAKMQDGGPE